MNWWALAALAQAPALLLLGWALVAERAMRRQAVDEANYATRELHRAVYGDRRAQATSVVRRDASNLPGA